MNISQQCFMSDGQSCIGHIPRARYLKEQQTSKVTCKIEGWTLFWDCTSSRATDPHRETYNYVWSWSSKDSSRVYLATLKLLSYLWTCDSLATAHAQTLHFGWAYIRMGSFSRVYRIQAMQAPRSKWNNFVYKTTYNGQDFVPQGWWPFHCILSPVGCSTMSLIKYYPQGQQGYCRKTHLLSSWLLTRHCSWATCQQAPTGQMTTVCGTLTWLLPISLLIPLAHSQNPTFNRPLKWIWLAQWKT